MTHADLLRLLLPPSSIDGSAPLVSTELHAVGAALDRAQVDADTILAEMDPRTCQATMPDWERVYGLPDRCVTEAQSGDQRRAALVAIVGMRGGQSRAFFIALAESLGYPGATIDEFRPANCNSDCNAALYSQADRSVWQINLPDTGGEFVANCNSPCDSPLRSWGDEAVECRINRFKPANTVALFAYV